MFPDDIIFQPQVMLHLKEQMIGKESKTTISTLY